MEKLKRYFHFSKFSTTPALSINYSSTTNIGVLWMANSVCQQCDMATEKKKADVILFYLANRTKVGVILM